MSDPFGVYALWSVLKSNVWSWRNFTSTSPETWLLRFGLHILKFPSWLYLSHSHMTWNLGQIGFRLISLTIWDFMFKNLQHSSCYYVKQSLFTPPRINKQDDFSASASHDGVSRHTILPLALCGKHNSTISGWWGNILNSFPYVMVLQLTQICSIEAYVW